MTTAIMQSEPSCLSDFGSLRSYVPLPKKFLVASDASRWNIANCVEAGLTFLPILIQSPEARVLKSAFVSDTAQLHLRGTSHCVGLFAPPPAARGALASAAPAGVVHAALVTGRKSAHELSGTANSQKQEGAGSETESVYTLAPAPERLMLGQLYAGAFK